MKSDHIFLSLGIDPNPPVINLTQFRQNLKKHMRFLDEQKEHMHGAHLKVQLAFFMRFGSKGIKLLEEFMNRYKKDFTIILDAKFNDIANTLKAYLEFVFCTLGAHSVTINPFLGEKTIALAFEECAKYAKQKGRVYVLCATSESSSSDFSYLQSNWQQSLKAISNIKDQVFKNDPKFRHLAGVVIGANHENILRSKELYNSKLSVLVPGLGAQGGNWNLIHECAKQNNEFVFNVGREIFSGGNITTLQMKKNLKNVQRYFQT